MEFVKRNGWKITWVALAVVAFFGTLGFLNEVFVEAPAREARAERLAAEMREIERQGDYDQCLQYAYIAYEENWHSKCEVLGRASNCTLYATEYSSLEAQYESDQKRCDLRYGK